jgi:hypothetical protein
VKPARLQGLRPLRTLPRALLAVLALPLFGAPAAAQVQLAPARDAMMFEDSGSLGNGGGNVRSMASGVSRATIPTMSGMVAAISGIIADIYLTRVADNEQALLEDHLTMDH